ncbi:MAG: 5'-3' exonuclease H3TH domain-containing protein, partial [Parvibaculum sp.]|nr:5'-3' exonuclease H3TH domain-containing protein [Parvibaculum sp.]
MAEKTGRSLKKGDHLFLVDGSGYIFRAYHALPPLTRKSDGMPVGAVAGFCNMLYKLIEDTKDEFEPTHLAVIFDAAAKTFRNDIYPEYKANRVEPPEDLRPQFALVRDATRAFGVPCIEKKGYEADDIIATYARLAHEAGARVTIVSSDKDLMQLVNDNVDMLDTMKLKTIAREQVIEKFGVPPEKVVEVQALAGDSTDNVPGVPGIGIKTAAQLIGEYGDLETLLARAGEIKQQKRRENLLAFAEQARISRRLVELDNNVPLEEPLEGMGIREPDPETLIGFFKDMEFNTLTRRVGERFNIDVDAIPAAGKHPLQTDGAVATVGDEAPKKDKQTVTRTARGGTPGVLPKGIDADFADAN